MSDFLFNSNFPAPGRLIAGKEDADLDRAKEDIDQNDLPSIRDNALMKTFYTHEDLKTLLAQPDCEGIRIYPVIDQNGNLSTLAVATNSKRIDMVKELAKPCFVSNGFEPASKISEDEGREAVGKYNEHLVNAPGDLGFALTQQRSRELTSSNFSKVFFTSSDINTLLGDDSKGIRFYTTKIKFSNRSRPVPTLTAVRVNTNNEEESSTALMSALPCPPNCGGGYIAEAAQAEPTPPDLQA